MKTTQRKVIEAYGTLNQMGRKVSGQTAFALFRFKQQQLKPVVEFQGEEEVKLVDKFGGKITEEGRIIFDDDQKRAEFLKEQRKLGEMECEVETIEIRTDEVPEITMQEIETLDGLIIFK